MVFKMLESRSSAAATLDYNYRKVADGSATIVAHYRLPNLSRSGVYDTFARLEYTDYPVKEVGFHMAVNPGPDDTCTEDQIIKAIYKTMYKLGYKSSPSWSSAITTSTAPTTTSSHQGSVPSPGGKSTTTTRSAGSRATPEVSARSLTSLFRTGRQRRLPISTSREIRSFPAASCRAKASILS